MADSEIIRMITQKLDKIEDKVDIVSDKLSSFEIKATEVLTVHDCDITALKLKVELMDKELKDKEAASVKAKSQNPISKFVNSDLMTMVFRALFLGLLTILTAFGTIKSDKAKTIFDSISPPGISDTLKPGTNRK